MLAAELEYDMTSVARAALWMWVFTFLPQLAAQEKPAGPLDVEPEELRAGLIATYTSRVDKEANLIRVDAQPALAWGHANPHSRLPAGGIDVTWSGVLFVKDAGPLTFEAFVGGELTVQVDGVTVLEGRGETDRTRIGAKEKLSRPPGLYRLRIQYRKLPDVAARLQIRWQGPGFGLEPIAPWHFKHLATDVPAAAPAEEKRALGRASVGQLGCARCHQSTFPAVTEPPPGPSLADLGQRVERDWLMRWLEDPHQVLSDARMPALFAADRTGQIERWLVADYLVGVPPSGGEDRLKAGLQPKGDHREGRKSFLSLGCVACHHIPEEAPPQPSDPGRHTLRGLTERLPAEYLAAFLANPHGRYPDGRMPGLPLTQVQARDVAAYLLLWAGPAAKIDVVTPPSSEELKALLGRLKARTTAAAGAALVKEKNCTACHLGLGAILPLDLPVTKGDGCLSGKTLPRFTLAERVKDNLQAYLKISRSERHPSPVESRRQLLDRSGCVRCHARDSERPPPLEQISSTIGGAYLQMIPFQRTPRLTHAHQKYTHAHLASAIREGVAGLRPAGYTFRMPAFGAHADALVQALAEADGEVPGGDEPLPKATDPTLATLTGPNIAGFQGYSCVACHLWNGQAMSSPDPGAIGPDLTRVAGRIRRDWFDRFLENPARFHPGTPMPTVFPRGKPATLQSFLDGDANKQKDALWHYFALGKDAPSPKPPPPLVVTSPSLGMRPLVSLIPIRTPDNKFVESITLLSSNHDLLVYDLGSANLHGFYTSGQILRNIQGRVRNFQTDGKQAIFPTPTSWQLKTGNKIEEPLQYVIESHQPIGGHDLWPDGVRIRYQIHFPSAMVHMEDDVNLPPERSGPRRRLTRLVGVIKGLASGQVLVISMPGGEKGTVAVHELTMVQGKHFARMEYKVPPAESVAVVKRSPLADPGKEEGPFERPGYRAIAYPRPKTPWGEDLIMPSALAVHPRDGRVFVASMKLGEIFVLHDPTGDGKKARFDNYARGLFQDAYSMLAEEDGLYVLHRRNLTRIVEKENALRFDRVAALPHGIADTYDYAYGLARDKSGAFVLSYAPYANRQMPGSGGALRLRPGQKPEEIAFGFRNPVGWCAGPEGEIFFTDNQGEWVATNKLCHVQEGKFFGFPNPDQKQHATKPNAPTALWVPYDWARSINGVTYDNTGGKFGPFAGQFFLAELMYGGAIVRASLEKVNGVYQGACFPFWGKGLMGPLTLAFDPRGKLYVGSVTEPGWMAQPDRGALYRIDFTGQTPFEMQTIQVMPRGFRIAFTAPADERIAKDVAAYRIEHYRYEYTGSYGSPELDRTRLAVEEATVAADGQSVELSTGTLAPGRVYMISAPGVRSRDGASLVHPTGAYTLNEVPGK